MSLNVCYTWGHPRAWQKMSISNYMYCFSSGRSVHLGHCIIFGYVLGWLGVQGWLGKGCIHLSNFCWYLLRIVILWYMLYQERKALMTQSIGGASHCSQTTACPSNALFAQSPSDVPVLYMLFEDSRMRESEGHSHVGETLQVARTKVIWE